MTARRSTRTTIGAALRAKFKSPREALERLGIDERVLSEPGLAYDGAKEMSKPKPSRLHYLLLTRTARIFNPHLAADAKVDYSPLYKGVTSKNLKARRPTIIADAKKLLKGKTLAKDAPIEGLAQLLHHLENPPDQANLDESVSGAQHRAMEAAAHGHSTLGIPKSVGSEFSHADKGHTFRDALPAFLKDHGLDEEAVKHVMDGWPSQDELPENALDEEEEGEKVDVEVEQGEDEIEEEEAEDKIEEEEGEDADIEEEEAEDRGAKDKHAKDRKAKDSKHAKDRKGAMDTKNFVTVDAMNKAVEAAVKKVRADQSATMDARAFVRPFVGELNMALDSAEKIYRAAAESLGIEDAETIHVSALPQMIKLFGKKNSMANDDGREIATDAAGAKSFAERFPGATRIRSV